MSKIVVAIVMAVTVVELRMAVVVTPLKQTFYSILLITLASIGFISAHLS